MGRKEQMLGPQSTIQRWEWLPNVGWYIEDKESILILHLPPFLNWMFSTISSRNGENNKNRGEWI